MTEDTRKLEQEWLKAHELSEQTRKFGDRELIEDREREEIALRTQYLNELGR